ncbi:MAG: ABC transporter substrate-binding protein, partial [Spirochaetota bacterium]
AVALDPDVIIIADMGIAGGDEARRWRMHMSLAAVRSNAIHIIEPYGICSTTVAAFPSAVKSIAKLIHGGAK